MALYERIMGIERPKISPHTVMACLAERARGQMTEAQVEGALELSEAEKAELATLNNAIILDITLTPVAVHDVLCLAEQQIAPYSTVAGVKTRLGV